MASVIPRRDGPPRPSMYLAIAMDEPTQIQVAPAREILPARPDGYAAAPVPLDRPPVDRCAVASAICGMTAIVPVVSQIAGLILGIMAFRRIRQARRAGLPLAGSGWAATGIVSSIFVLLCWIAVVAILGSVVFLFSHTASALDKAILAPPR